MPELMKLMKNAQAKFRPHVIQVVFDVLNQPKTLEYFGHSLIAQWLRSEDEVIAGIVQSGLTMNPDPLLFNKDTIETLLNLAPHPQQEVRAKAFAPLLSAMSCRPSIFIEYPTFVHDCLTFTLRKLPPGMMKKLLRNLQTILKDVRSISDGLVVRLI
jgi:hypothetical protein